MELLFNQYLAEFIAVLSITVLTIITPGPDFFIVVRNSLYLLSIKMLYSVTSLDTKARRNMMTMAGPYRMLQR